MNELINQILSGLSPDKSIPIAPGHRAAITEDLCEGEILKVNCTLLITIFLYSL